MTGVQTCALRSEEHTSELQSHDNLVCRLLLEKKTIHGQPALAARARRGGGPGPTDAGARAGRERRQRRRCRDDEQGTGGLMGGYFFLNNPPPPEFSPFPLPPVLRI